MRTYIMIGHIDGDDDEAEEGNSNNKKDSSNNDDDSSSSSSSSSSSAASALTALPAHLQMQQPKAKRQRLDVQVCIITGPLSYCKDIKPNKYIRYICDVFRIIYSSKVNDCCKSVSPTRAQVHYLVLLLIVDTGCFFNCFGDKIDRFS